MLNVLLGLIPSFPLALVGVAGSRPGDVPLTRGIPALSKPELLPLCRVYIPVLEHPGDMLEHPGDVLGPELSQ